MPHIKGIILPLNRGIVRDFSALRPVCPVYPTTPLFLLMRILALETSCDDTACAIVDNGRTVLANVVQHQNRLHAVTGGVVPEVAARQHMVAVNTAIEHALSEANCTLDSVDTIAATLGPGLIGSLVVGVSAAKSISLATGKPFIPVHHLVAHVCANLLENDLTPPFLCLLVSGGHTQLMAIDEQFNATIAGETLDDAVGEAYDKVGRLLGLPFPGGPQVDKLANTGNPHAYPLPVSSTQHPWDFSYSGLKTAMARLIKKEAAINPSGQLTPTQQANLCASFQHAAVKPLVAKAIAYATQHGHHTITVCGGVSANSGLRRTMADACAQNNLTLHVPGVGACTDNAAMVAAAAYFSPLMVPGDPLAADVFSRKPMPATT